MHDLSDSKYECHRGQIMPNKRLILCWWRALSARLLPTVDVYLRSWLWYPSQTNLKFKLFTRS